MTGIRAKLKKAVSIFCSFIFAVLIISFYLLSAIDKNKRREEAQYGSVREYRKGRSIPWF